MAIAAWRFTVALISSLLLTSLSVASDIFPLNHYTATSSVLSGCRINAAVMCFGFSSNTIKESRVTTMNRNLIQTTCCLNERVNVLVPRFSRCQFTRLRNAARESPDDEEVVGGFPDEEEAGTDHNFPSTFPPIKIVYEDAHIIVVSKPGGMLVHRSKESTRDTVFLLQTLRDQLGGRKVPETVRDARPPPWACSSAPFPCHSGASPTAALTHRSAGGVGIRTGIGADSDVGMGSCWMLGTRRDAEISHPPPDRQTDRQTISFIENRGRHTAWWKARSMLRAGGGRN
jgi:hypothetical protein